jgi:hypothetical protein
MTINFHTLLSGICFKKQKGEFFLSFFAAEKEAKEKEFWYSIDGQKFADFIKKNLALPMK